MNNDNPILSISWGSLLVQDENYCSVALRLAPLSRMLMIESGLVDFPVVLQRLEHLSCPTSSLFQLAVMLR